MLILIQLSILGVLFAIFIQDIKYNAVYWFWFPILIILFVSAKLQLQRLTDLWYPIIVNSTFVLLQLLLLSIYFSIKNKRWLNITNGLLGLGDILFLFSIGFYLSIVNFIIFYLISLLLALIIWLIWQALAVNKSKHIPLAGLQAIIFIVAIMVDWYFPDVDLTTDDRIISIFY